MICLDTNVLVRILVEDDDQQVLRAHQFLERLAAEGRRILIPDIVLCETVWVLRQSYKLSKGEIVEALESLSRAIHAEFQSIDRFVSAIEAYRQGRGDFADYMIRAVATEHGCTVATFDAAVEGEDGFSPVE